MATWYVNSAATGTGAGTSWANACTTLAAAITLSAAGDDFDVASTHAETTAASLTLTFKGTAAAPNRVFSCDTTNSPAQASDLVAGASIATTGASAMTVAGSFYAYGLTFGVGTGTTPMNFNFPAAGQVVLDTCLIALLTTGAGANIALAGDLTFTNTGAQVSATSQGLLGRGGRFYWRDTASPISGATLPANLFLSSGAVAGAITIDGVDLSALTGTLVSAVTIQQQVTLINCRLGSAVIAATPTAPYGGATDLINCDSAATGNRQERHWYQGTLTNEPTVILAGGASDGVAGLSWKVVTSANAKVQSPFECFQIAQWFGSGLGASHTITFQALGPSGLTNADVWVDVRYLGSGATPIASKATSAPATQLTAGSGLSTAGAGSWGGSTGLTAYTIAVAFTPQIAGYVRATVRVAKPSTTLYIDPAPVIV